MRPATSKAPNDRIDGTHRPTNKAVSRWPTNQRYTDNMKEMNAAAPNNILALAVLDIECTPELRPAERLEKPRLGGFALGV